jgi:hypothetical protein
MKPKFNDKKEFFLVGGLLGITFLIVYLLNNNVGSINKSLKRDVPVETNIVRKIDTMRDIAKKHKAVYVRGQDIYWGDLKDIIKPVVFFKHTIRYETSSENNLQSGDEAMKNIVDELRGALRAFEKEYAVKVVWHKTSNTPDVTEKFINFWAENDHG